MDYPTPANLISIDDATTEFGVSRSTIFRVFNAAGLTRYRRPGDRKSYLVRSELQQALSFHPVE